ncbi:MAG TPA: fibronectin type III domain-containing protein [Clostridiaceae bacterium]|nr:fibronectin type III domain-containing protein [Clostridiaceae bacterium]
MYIKIKKALAFFAAFLMSLSVLPGFGGQVMANGSSVNVYVTDYRAGTVTFRWDGISYAMSVKVTWHSPEKGEEQVIVNQTGNSFQIGGLQNNYIYDIKVEIFDDENGQGRKIAEGFLYFCPDITFYSTPVRQDYVDLPGGGREIGSKPGLAMRWAMPKVWDGSSFVYIDQALTHMEEQIRNVYRDNRELASFGFRINISSNRNTLNSGSLQQSILIDKSAAGYEARTSGEQNVACRVRDIDNDGYLSFDLIGREDGSAKLPDPKEYELPDSDILPGSVYYMNIKPVFKDSRGENVNAITVGAPSQMNGSMLQGAVPYTYTPIRFQLSKDALNNVYVKIYKLNQGSLDLPRLYYEIQAGDDDSIPGDWDVKDTMDDSYFAYGSPYAVSIITGLNISNIIYYKIVVKSDSVGDRITSQPLPYKIEDDTNRPPAPQNVKVTNPVLSIREVVDPDTGEVYTEKTTDFVLSWEKPSDWDTIISNTDPDHDVYMHVLLSTSQTDLNLDPAPYLVAEGKVYGQFQPRFRLVKYFNLRSPNVRVNGNRLEYVLKGFELFTGEESDGISDEIINNAEGYPDFLLPNTVYYLQMYTTKSAAHKGSTNEEHMSGKSITTSFTTLSSAERDVPLPLNFRLNANAIDSNGDNYIVLSLEKVKLDWNYYAPKSAANKNIYYDYYISTSLDPDSFILLGTTQDPGGEIDFLGLDAASTIITASIKSFRSQELVNRFGHKIRPNSVYYFMVRTRLVVEGQEDKISDFTSVLPVTTIRDLNGTPDEDPKRPLAPVDFGVAGDSGAIPGVAGSIVSFEWTRRETNEIYQIICTSDYVKPDAIIEDYQNDQTYLSFIAAFGGPININPEGDPLQINLEYNKDTKVFRYTIDRWISPNRLYYFSIRAISRTDGRESAWVSIPVTTALIDQPVAIEVVYDYVLKLSWEDSSVPDSGSYRVYLKENNKPDFKLLDLSNYQIVKDGNKYYATIHNLKENSLYDVRVYRSLAQGVPVYERYNLSTRDGCHQIEVAWKGLTGYKYELAIKAETDADYTILTDGDLELFLNNDRQTASWHVEKTLETAGTAYSNYFARIRTIPVYTDGVITGHNQLMSNTRYYIKVRSVKVDAVDTTKVYYSKYAGPCDTRTEFNKEDYEQNEKDTLKKLMYMDRIDSLNSQPYWMVDMGSTPTIKILLKSDRVSSMIENSGSETYTLDLEEISEGHVYNEASTGQEQYIIYIPFNIIQSLNAANTSFNIRMDTSEISIRPESIGARVYDYIGAAVSPGINDVFIRLTIMNGQANVQGLPAGFEAVSECMDFLVDVLGVAKNRGEINSAIKGFLFDEKTGLVNSKLDILMNPYNSNALGTIDEIRLYIEELVGELEQELSIYIYNILGESILSERAMEALNNPVLVGMNVFNSQGYIWPYVLPPGTGKWMEIEGETVFLGSKALFNTRLAGRIALLKGKKDEGNMPELAGIPENIADFVTRNNLTEVFEIKNPMYFYSNATVRDTVLIFEKLSGMKAIPGQDLKAKCKVLGLDTILDAGNEKRSINRQEAALVLARLYSLKNGVNIDKFRPSRLIFINDEGNIDNKALSKVYLSVDLGFLSLDGKGNFLPQKAVTVIELLSAYEKVFDKTR